MRYGAEEGAAGGLGKRLKMNPARTSPPGAISMSSWSMSSWSVSSWRAESDLNHRVASSSSRPRRSASCPARSRKDARSPSSVLGTDETAVGCARARGPGSCDQRTSAAARSGSGSVPAISRASAEAGEGAGCQP